MYTSHLDHPSIRFGPSPIHGMGAFALVPIRVGTMVIEYVGERINKTESRKRCEADNHFIFFLDEEFDLDGNVPWNPARLINHCCEPNCDAEMIDSHIWIVARRDIQPGEEVTFNYGYDLEEYKDYPCRCGASNCQGFILAEEYHKYRAT